MPSAQAQLCQAFLTKSHLLSVAEDPGCADFPPNRMLSTWRDFTDHKVVSYQWLAFTGSSASRRSPAFLAVKGLGYRKRPLTEDPLRARGRRRGEGQARGGPGSVLFLPPPPAATEPGGVGAAPSLSPQLLLSRLTSPGQQTGRQRLRLPKSEPARGATAMPRAFGVLLALLLSGGLGGGQAQRREPQQQQQHRRQPPAHQQRGTVEAPAPGHTLCRGPRPVSRPFVLRLRERDRFLALPWGARFGGERV